jgi:hypothetical protein
MWAGPSRKGIIITGHWDLTNGVTDLNSFDAVVRKEMIADAGAKNVQPSRPVKICGGKQDGTLTTLTMKMASQPLVDATEEVVVAFSDRGYLAQYVRHHGVPEDPAAMRSLLSLCAPQ